MADSAFKRSQLAGVDLGHVAPINALVAALEQESGVWLPRLAPIYGGMNAGMLIIAESPGPMTDPSNPLRPGSGFLCLENDDPTAARRACLLDEAGIDPSRVTSWNAYPWPTPRGKIDLNAGVEPLRRLLDLLQPRPRVIMLSGKVAQGFWNKNFKRKHPEIAARFAPDRVLETWHTANLTFTKDRDERFEDLRRAFQSAARLLDSEG